jgi:tetrahydrodipicolinate N-succinyltransferase
MTNPTKKYELLPLEDGKTLHRIRALRDIPERGVKAGDLGGWIESEANLSHDGTCWVSDSARVRDKAVVRDNAVVRDKAVVRDFARVRGSAVVRGTAVVSDIARVRDSAVVSEHAVVSGDAVVSEHAVVRETAVVSGSARVREHAVVRDKAEVRDNAVVRGTAVVCNNAVVRDFARVRGSADYMVFKNSWSSGRWFTWTRSDNQWQVGCFRGTGEELVAKAYKDSQLSGDCYKATVDYVAQIQKIQQIKENQND